MTTMSVVGECFFWYWLTRVVLHKFHTAVKRLCVCVCVCVVRFAQNLVLGRGRRHNQICVGLEYQWFPLTKLAVNTVLLLQRSKCLVKKSRC